ncbi:hypothetical protein KY289_020534 [Solanum tuberosum]|nr:hypothetical protein KY289_020534 [Solanum tuberosum]
MTPKDGADKSEEYLQIFIHSSVPAALHDVFPFVRKLATRLSLALELRVQLADLYSYHDVCEFIKFMHPIKCAI